MIRKGWGKYVQNRHMAKIMNEKKDECKVEERCWVEKIRPVRQRR